MKDSTQDAMPLHQFEDAIRDMLDLVSRYFGKKTCFVAHTDEHAFRVLETLKVGMAGIENGAVLPIHESRCEMIHSGGREPVVNEDTASHLNAQKTEVTENARIGSCLGVPVLLRDGTMYGTLCVLDSQPGQFFEDDRAYLQKFANYLSYVIELGRMSVRDALTGLYNRGFMNGVFADLARESCCLA
ncbi:GAF domain-containing protein [Paenibacillus methanolicus]|uniref:GAF domain-containing protein n=1 Tax=Paenibacillus methanolicus TaxID=582686 RepID=A0A5S5CEF2_9BACL|nr:GAF domain-containing protein [Paenibacillus methanolicus]TYP76393.1 GAF domain-containing protein [Paenibacillus methanolicus]